MITDLNSLYRLNKSQIKPAADMFACAFMNNPEMLYLLPDEDERQIMSAYVFRYIVEYGISCGEVYATSPNLEGIAAWLFSENMHAPSSLSISKKLGEANISKLTSFVDYLTSVHEQHAPFKHWYLLLLGVDPVNQGKGYASTLLKPMFARIDSGHLPCYLETHKTQNVPIYQHYGFKILDESIVPNTQITNWAMLRE